MNEATLLCDQLALLSKGALIETGSPQELIKKYHSNKMVTVRYESGREITVSYEDLKALDEVNKIETIHSLEPTLEDIFITLTGGKLNV